MSRHMVVSAGILLISFLHIATAQNLFRGMFGDQGFGIREGGLIGGRSMGLFQGVRGLGQTGAFTGSNVRQGIFSGFQDIGVDFPRQSGSLGAGMFGMDALTGNGLPRQTGGRGGQIQGLDTFVSGSNLFEGGFGQLANLGQTFTGTAATFPGLGGNQFVTQPQMFQFGGAPGTANLQLGGTTGAARLNLVGNNAAMGTQNFQFGGAPGTANRQLGGTTGAARLNLVGNNAAMGTQFGMGEMLGQASSNIFTDPTTGQRVRIIPRTTASNLRTSRIFSAPTAARNVAQNQFFSQSSGRPLRLFSRNQANTFLMSNIGGTGQRLRTTGTRPSRTLFRSNSRTGVMNNMRIPMSQLFLDGQQLASATGFQLPRARNVF